MKNIFIIIFALLVYNVDAQLNLSIKEINVSNIYVHRVKNITSEDEDSGPYIYMTLIFDNKTDSVASLHPSKSEIDIIYNYMGMPYFFKIEPMSFKAIDTINLLPKQKKETSFGEYLLLGTGILNRNKKDYVNELLQILPTVRIKYREQGINIKSTEILNVNIK